MRPPNNPKPQQSPRPGRANHYCAAKRKIEQGRKRHHGGTTWFDKTVDRRTSLRQVSWGARTTGEASCKVAVYFLFWFFSLIVDILLFVIPFLYMRGSLLSFLNSQKIQVRVRFRESNRNIDLTRILLLLVFPPDLVNMINTLWIFLIGIFL